MTIRGSVDQVTPTEINGWAYAPEHPTVLRVQALLNHELIGEAAADVFRGDLQAAGLGNGRCGFTITLHREISPAYLPFISIRPEGGDVEFTRFSPSGFAEYFQQLYQAFPMAGRHRSQFGGLWTDRTDATRILGGKEAVGIIDPSLSDKLSRLICEGACSVPLGFDPKPGQEREIVGCRALNVLLRSILEDRAVFMESTMEGSSLTQPSRETTTFSPAECVGVLVPLSEQGVEVEIVRDSHILAEFGSDGASRWVQRTDSTVEQLAPLGQMATNRRVIQCGEALVIGAGTIYRINRLQSRRGALRLVVLPARAAPADLAVTGIAKMIDLESGDRLIFLER